ncbi:MAG TPA: helix-turn-helix domain-containing protein [Cytophagales bacterium]|nr:helix-turn-helix domain-containing protein [Cytophagales bacterium]
MDIGVVKLVLVAGAFQGIILSFLLFTRTVNKHANRILSVLLVLLSVHIMLVAFDEQAFFMKFPHLSHVSWLIPTLMGPLILIYVQRITLATPHFRKTELLYFIPFVIWLICLLPYFMKPAEFKREYLNDYAASIKDDFGSLNEILNYVLLLFFGLSIFVYHQHKRRIVEFYSNISKVRLKWLGQFLYLAFIVLIVSIFGFYGRKYEIPLLKELYPYHFVSVVFLIYWTGYKAFAQPEIFGRKAEYEEAITSAQKEESINVEINTSEEKNDLAQSTTQRSGMDLGKRLKMAEELERLMIQEKLFLNSELTIQDLTEKLDTSRQYISEILNGQLGKNFYDFINDYRIEEFKRKVVNPKKQNLTLLSLALESGFNSKATFNAVFKKKTGSTPSEYFKLVKSTIN